jgi:hypothetical protein
VAAIILGIVIAAPVSADPLFPPSGESHPAPPIPNGLGEYTPLRPARILDTRTGLGHSGTVGAGQAITVDVTGVGGVPNSGVAAVVINVTVTGPTKGSFLTIYPTGVSRPTASNLNFAAGQTIPNLVVAKVGSDGKIKAYNQAGSTHLIFDVVGWYGGTLPEHDSVTGTLLRALRPARILDTRTGLGHSGTVGAGQAITVDVTGVGGVPNSGVAAVVINVTVTGPTKGSFLTIYPTGVSRPTASNLNFAAGQTIPNLVVAKVGSDGKIRAYNQAGSTHLIFDVVGWFAKAGTAPEDTTGGPQVVDGTSLGAPLSPAERAAITSPGGNVTAEGAARAVEQMDAAFRASADASALGQAAPRTPLLQSSPAYPIGEASHLFQVSPAVGRLYMYDCSLIDIDDGSCLVTPVLAGTCSASVVARNLLMTAGHCVHLGHWYWGFTFQSGQVGSTALSTWYSVQGQWAWERWTVSQDFGADYALVVMQPAWNGGKYIGDTTGRFPVLYNSSGGPKYTIGYPSEGVFGKQHTDGANGLQPACTTDYCLPYHCYSNVGEYAKTSDDATVGIGAWYTVGWGCYATGGASGGPVFEFYNGTWYVNGANSTSDTAVSYTDGCPVSIARPLGVCVWYAKNQWSPYINEKILDLLTLAGAVY